MKVPNAKNAVVDIRKLRDYCLNPMHDEGKHRARLFKRALGMTAIDSEKLGEILLTEIKNQEAQLGRNDEYGQRYVVDFTLEWHGKQTKIRSTWIIEHDSTIPRLTSCYPI